MIFFCCINIKRNYYILTQKNLLEQAKEYYENNKERLHEQAKNKYRQLSHEKKQHKNRIWKK